MPAGDLLAEQDPGTALVAFRGGPVGGAEPLPPSERSERQALKELPQPQVDFTFGLLNLNPAPWSPST